MAIEVGMSYTLDTVVDETNVAGNVGSGDVDVFATPMMIALMEQAASRCVAAELQPQQATVGSMVNVTHTAATPRGLRVWATATVTATEGKRIDFTVSAKDEVGPIGEGTHSRFIIDLPRFMDKASQRKNNL